MQYASLTTEELLRVTDLAASKSPIIKELRDRLASSSSGLLTPEGVTQKCPVCEAALLVQEGDEGIEIHTA